MRGLGPGPGPDAGPGRSRLQPGHYRRHGGPGLRLQAQSGLLRGFWSSRAAGFGGHGAAHPLGQPRLAGDRGRQAGRHRPVGPSLRQGDVRSLGVRCRHGERLGWPRLGRSFPARRGQRRVRVGPRLQPRLRRFSGPGNRRRPAVPAVWHRPARTGTKRETSGWWSARLSPNS